MKNLVSAIVTIAFLLYPSICFSSYIIQLKNGGKFITYHYWEEGGEIKFHIYGGVMGIPKDLVRRIEESDVVYREKTVSLEKPEPVPVQTEPKADAKTQKATPPVESKKDKRFMKEFDLLKQRFRDVDIWTKEEILKFAGDLVGFRNKLLTGGMGRLYEDELVEISDMIYKLKTVLKAMGH